MNGGTQLGHRVCLHQVNNHSGFEAVLERSQYGKPLGPCSIWNVMSQSVVVRYVPCRG